MTLFDPLPGLVHADPHDTELEAAESVAEHTGRLRLFVAALLAASPAGLTDDEGGQLLALVLPYADRLTFGRRRQELYTAGRVSDSGLRRRTPRGRNAIVWTVRDER